MREIEHTETSIHQPEPDGFILLTGNPVVRVFAAQLTELSVQGIPNKEAELLVQKALFALDGKPSKHRPVSCELSSSKLRELIGQDVLGVEVWEPFLSQPVHEPPIPAELIQAWLLEPRQHVLLLDTGMSIGEFIARFNQGEGESFETRDSFRMVLDNTRPIECLNETLEAPEWRLVAKSTTDGTKNIPKEEQLAHVKQAGRRPGRARDYVFAIGLTQMTTGHILFEEESTNCEESIEVCTCRNVFMIENSENSRGIPSDRVGLGSTPDVTAGINW